MKGNYTCSKCGATGSSKCIGQRTFFPDDQNEAMLSWVLKRDVKSDDCQLLDNRTERKHTVTIIHEWINETTDHEAALLNAFRTIRSMSEETMRHYICDHRYELTSETCALGCCKRKEA